jgi:hypothetical protein
MLKVSQIALLVLLLLGITLTSYQALQVFAKEENGSQARIWLLSQYMTGGFGFYVNGTIYHIMDGKTPGVLEDNAYSDLSTVLYWSIWNKFTYVLTSIEPTAYLAKTNQTSALYLVNPTILKNKWIMPNTSNAYYYGIDYNKALLASEEFLEQFPTAYYF